MCKQERNFNVLILACIQKTVFEHFVVISKHRQIAVKFLCHSMKLPQLGEFLVVEDRRLPINHPLYLLECIVLNDE